MRLQVIGAGGILDTAIERLAKCHEKCLGRADRRGIADPFLPALAGKRARRLQRRVKIGKRCRIVRQQLTKPAFQPACASTPPVLGAADPGSQLGRFLGAEIDREGAVGSIEQMMPLIEHIAGRAAAFIRLIPIVPSGRRIGGVDHHQRMIADHNVGAACAAHRFLDKAAVVVGTGAVDAFPAPVGQPYGLGASDKVGQPGRKRRAGQIAVIGRPGPARHQPERGAAPRCTAKLRQRLLKVEKAEIVFAALADDHLALPAGGVGIEPRQLRGDLMLQRSGES